MLPPATPSAFPGTQGVEGLDSGGLKGYNITQRRILGQNYCISIIQVFCPFRKQLPHEGAAASPASLGRVHNTLVNRGHEGVMVTQVVPRIFSRDSELCKHDRHSQVVLCILNVSLHPRFCELDVCIRDCLGNP